MQEKETATDLKIRINKYTYTVRVQKYRRYYLWSIMLGEKCLVTGQSPLSMKLHMMLRIATYLGEQADQGIANSLLKIKL